LCEQDSPIVALWRPDLYESIGSDLQTKIDTLVLDTADLFPLSDNFSGGVDREAFLQSQLIQPDLFIRVKRGREEKVKAELQKNAIQYKELSAQAIALPNGTKLQNLSSLDGDYEVQDWSSQRTIDFMDAKEGEHWWDACAGSGGKALMFLDKYPKVNLLVSDTRLSILRNLDERFEQSGVNANYGKKIIDLTGDLKPALGTRSFDGIILDVPCSGSGTWGRTPEMKVQFSNDRLAEFVSLQKAITSNVASYLKSGKVLTYITCSVYEDENEAVVRYVAAERGLHIESMQVLGGWRAKADTMFVACLRKP
jgi:16S rRNA (cytosine967-C5)-methyltransferase